MNILKRELRQGLRPFVFWLFGIGFLVMGGMVKFLGVGGTQSGSISGMMDMMPKPVLAMFGMAEVNIETFGGFYSILQFYAIVAVCFYAVYLGTNCVNREDVDKTYEFLFTKPCGRLQILFIKMFAALIFLVSICVLNGVFSYLAPRLYRIENSIVGQMYLYSMAMLLVALFFFALSMALSALLKKAERAVQVSNGLVLLGYGLSVVFDMDSKYEFLRTATPFKYFRPGELMDGSLNLWYTILLAVVSIILISLAFICFKKKDLTAA